MMALDASLVSISVKTYQDYVIRAMEFGLINTQSGLRFAQDVWTAKSPDDFGQAMIDFGRRQFERWTEELEELSAITGGKKNEDGEVVPLGD